MLSWFVCVCVVSSGLWNSKLQCYCQQLLEAHRTPGQMLEERMNQTEASVRDTSLAGGNSAARRKRHLELTMDDSGLERLRREGWVGGRAASFDEKVSICEISICGAIVNEKHVMQFLCCLV